MKIKVLIETIFPQVSPKVCHVIMQGICSLGKKCFLLDMFVMKSNNLSGQEFVVRDKLQLPPERDDLGNNLQPAYTATDLCWRPALICKDEVFLFTSYGIANIKKIPHTGDKESLNRCG